ncbi:putative RDD family membrane protein YckC [Tenacibaculum skagerrakense]|uniref:Putative RDD family membrane protein YckC n=1 Tax=Tenacibaculum skagerrakense TaxID=186571 RepID=A0A4R2NK97_9FLAO|nr:RDD family protein [Tenacibaculum skagerrakense]TCP21685.1 putative RDD family membrane protein YckC [Tenacibaculum skagerrakense]
MKTLQINTTQNVRINFELANVGQRLLAFILDNVVKLAYIYLIIEVFDFSLIRDATDGDGWSIKAIDILMFLPITFYSLYSEILMNGQTLGKRILKLRVINIEGFKPSSGDYVIRWFLRMVDFNLFMLLFVYFYSMGYANSYFFLIYMIFLIGKTIGFFMIVFTKKNQRVGDMAANTVVVSLKDEASFSKTILENIKEDYKPIYANVIKLSDNDARIIKDTYVRARNKKDYNTLIKLRVKIEEVTDVKKPKETTDLDFIATILKDFNFYTKD